MVTEYPLRITLELSRTEADKIQRQVDQLGTPSGGFVPAGFGGFGPMAAGPPGGIPLARALGPVGGAGPQDDSDGFLEALGLSGGESLTGALSTGFSSLLGPLVGILGAMAIISGILGNEFSALSDLVELSSALISLYLKPVSDLLFTLFKPFLIAFIKILPLWLQFVQDPAKGFLPLITAIAENLILAAGQVLGIGEEDLRLLMATVRTELIPALSALAVEIVPLIPLFTDLAIDALPFAIASVIALGVAVEAATLAVKSFRFQLNIFEAKASSLFNAFDYLRESSTQTGFALRAFEAILGEFDWGDFITVLNWGTFIGLLSWAIFVPSMSWPSFIPSLKWSDFVPSLSLGGGGFSIPGLDFIKTPQGQILRTSPEDFLIGTKDPARLFAGGSADKPTTLVIAPVFNGLTFREAERRFENQLNLKLRRFFS